MKEGEYGICTLYSCMKIEQWNSVKLFCEGGGVMSEKEGGGESTVNTHVNVTVNPLYNHNMLIKFVLLFSQRAFSV
jgi:hypothetical protein